MAEQTRPFASEAQREKFRQLLVEGKISQDQFDAREVASAGLELPTRAEPRKRTVGPSRAPTAQKFNNTRY